MLDGEQLAALGDKVIRCGNRDGLWDEPVRAVKDERHTNVAAIELDSLRAGALIGFTAGRRCRDADAFLRRTRENNLIGVLRKSARGWRGLKDANRTVIEAHLNACSVVVIDLHREILREDRVVSTVDAEDALVDHATVSFEAAADDDDGFAIREAAHIERVCSEAADGFEHNILRSADDEECVVTFECIDGQFFDAVVGDEKSGTEDAFARHHKVVAEFGADDRQSIKSIAALDAHRRIYGVIDEVRTLTTVDVGKRLLRILRIDFYERADTEGIIVLLTEEEEFREVAIDGEAVATRSAAQLGRGADAITEVTLGGECGREVVIRQQAVVRIGCIAWRLVDLADLERVVASIAEDGHRRVCVVEYKRVVAVAAKHGDPSTEGSVVVHPLCASVLNRSPRRVGFECDNRARTEEEEVGGEGAVNAQRVRGVAAFAIDDVD